MKRMAMVSVVGLVMLQGMAHAAEFRGEQRDVLTTATHIVATHSETVGDGTLSGRIHKTGHGPTIFWEPVEGR